MLINENLIVMNLAASDKTRAVQILAEKAAAAGRISSVSQYTAAVLQRESDFSTAIGFGAAIAHGKSESVLEPFLMYASADAVEWQAQVSDTVTMIFLIGVPISASPSIHLQILARLSRLMMRSEFRKQLCTAESISAVLQVLNDYEVNF